MAYLIQVRTIQIFRMSNDKSSTTVIQWTFDLCRIFENVCKIQWYADETITSRLILGVSTNM